MQSLLKRAILALFTAVSLNSYAGLFDGEYSQAQSFDVARSGCSVTGGSCTVSNMINPYVAPWSNRVQVTWSTGDYMQFYDTGAGGAYNIGLKQFHSDGTLVRIVSSSGYVTAIGDGIVYIGQPTQSGGTGYFFSNSQGFSYGSSTTFTVTKANPTMSDLTSYAATTTPLAAGQTAAPATPQPNPTAVTNSIITTVTPTSTNSPSGEGATKAVDGTSTSKYLNFDRANAGFTITLNAGKVINGVKFTTANDYEPRDPTKFTLYGSNDGKTWTEITANQSTTLSSISGRYTQTSMVTINNSNPYVYYFITFPSIKAIDTYGSVAGCRSALGTLACDSMQIGEVTYYYDSNNTATSTSTLVGSIANPGTPGSTSSMSATVVSTTAGTPIVTTTTTTGAPTVTTTTSTRTVTGTDSNGNPTVTTYTDVTTTTQANNTVTTTTTPTTVTTYSDGTTTTTNGTATSTTSTIANGSPTSTTASTLLSTAVTENVITAVTTYTTPVVTSVDTNGTPIVTVVETYTRDRQVKVLNIDKNVQTTTVTPITTVTTTVTPGTTVTTTTPTTTTTDANGNVISITYGTSTVVTTDATTTTSATSYSTNTVVDSTDTLYSTRIDQMDKLSEINTRINYSLLSDPLSRNLVKDDRISNRSLDDRDINVYIHGSKTQSNLADGYSYTATIDTYGAEHRISRSSLLGIQYNRVTTTLDGTNGGGNLYKEAFSIYNLYVHNDWVFKTDVGQSNNTYYTYHTLPELNMSNNAKTYGQDTWAHLRVYTPAMKGFRPFVGGRKEHNSRDYVMENGSFLTAVDYNKINQTVDTTEYGIRYDYQFNQNWAVSSEVAQNNRNLATAYGTLMYNAQNNSTMILKIGKQRQDGVVADTAQVQIAIRF